MHERLLSHLPSVSRVLDLPFVDTAIQQHGRSIVVDSIRAVIDILRNELQNQGKSLDVDIDERIETLFKQRLSRLAKSNLNPVFNLTGTVLHTNLGRAVLPTEAIEAATAVMQQACNLEYDIDDASRGDRDSHVNKLLCELTGAEAATVVNNNAAAVFLVLNELAAGKEVVISRGELVEIGGSFRIPDIMTRAGCCLREVGTTNRTHLADFQKALGDESGMLLKVHTSNYIIQGFTSSVAENELASLAHDHDLPFVVDLGSGSLIDLKMYGLPKEPTPQETLANGADVVTFSGDKLLGGPQAGIIVGQKKYIERLKRNPLKRALRVGKTTLASLEAVLKLYHEPEMLHKRLPTLQLLLRSVAELEKLGKELEPAVARVVQEVAKVGLVECKSQIGSGALPVETLPSIALVLIPHKRGNDEATVVNRLANAFRSLPIPIIGKTSNGGLYFDLRCLHNKSLFLEQLSQLNFGAAP